VLPQRLSQSLKEFSWKEGSTLFMTLLAGYAALLARLAEEDDVSIGIPITNRTRVEVEGLIGFFVNSLVIRADLGGQPGFRAFGGRVGEAGLGAYAHQDVPLEMVVDALQPERSLSHAPLFQVMFTLQNEAGARPTLGGVRVEGTGMGASTGTSKFDLTLSIQESHAGLRCGFEYSTELFEARTIERMARQFELLLEGAVGNPEKPLREIAMMGAEEREQMLVGWNQAESEYPEHSGLQELFEQQVARQRESTAIVWGEERLTYVELNRRANQVAHYLKERG